MTTKLNIDEKALFDMFVSDNEYRPQIHKPFLQDGYVNATDANILIRIRRDLLRGEYSSNPKAPTVSKVMTKPNFDKTVTLEKLEAAIAQCPSVDEEVEISPAVECPDCDGDGEVEWTYEDKDFYTHTEYYRCPVCNGSGIVKPACRRKTGRKIPEYNAPIDVYGLSFRAELLLKLCDAMKLIGVTEARYIARYEGAANIFRLLDGVDIVLMPLYETDPVAKYK